MSSAHGSTVWSDGRAARHTTTGERIVSARRSGETEEEFLTRLRWGRFDELAVAYVDEQRENNMPDGTLKQYRSDLNCLLLPRVGDAWLTDCDRVAFRDLVDDVAEAHGEQRVAAAVRTLGAVLTWAMAEGHWPAHVAPFGGAEARKAIVNRHRRNASVDAIARPKRPRIGVEDCPTWDDVCEYSIAVADAAVVRWGEGARVLGDLPKVQFLTGTRIGTVFALRASSFHLNRERVHIHYQVDRSRSWSVPRNRAPEVLATLRPPLILAKNKLPDGHEAAVWEWAVPYLAELAEAATEQRDGWLFAAAVPSKRPLDRTEELLRHVREETGYAWASHWHRHAYASINLASPDNDGYGRTVATVASWLGDGIDVTSRTYWHPETEMASGWSSRRPSRRRANRR